MRHILLVDDDVNFRRSLTIQLELEGHSVICRENGEEALTTLSRASSDDDLPDIVISDVRMPGMDGETFLTSLRGVCPLLPVLVISAFDPPETLNGYRYLRKPFKLAEMIEAIDGLVTGA